LIVRPLMATWRPRLMWNFDLATSNTRDLPPALTVTLRSAGPTMLMFWLMSNSPLVSVIVKTFVAELYPGSVVGMAKLIVSPLWAEATAARSEPPPLSRVLWTVTVLGTQRSSIASSEGRKNCRAAQGVFLNASRPNTPRQFDSQRVIDMARVS